MCDKDTFFNLYDSSHLYDHSYHSITPAHRFRRGDNLIAGYNTASEKEREQYHIKRLRLVIAGIMLATIILFWIPILMNDKDPHKLIVLIGMFPICFIGIILANTWAKKK